MNLKTSNNENGRFARDLLCSHRIIQYLFSYLVVCSIILHIHVHNLKIIVYRNGKMVWSFRNSAELIKGREEHKYFDK